MISNIYKHDAVVFDEKFDRDAIGKIDRHRMESFQFPSKGMEPKGWMMGLGFQELKCFEIC